MHAQPFLCVKSSAFVEVKRAFYFRKMFNMAGTFFWSNIFAPPKKINGYIGQYHITTLIFLVFLNFFGIKCCLVYGDYVISYDDLLFRLSNSS